jgi:hypothetical protein
VISKYILPVFAIAAVFLLVAVPYSSAAGNEIVQHNIELAVDSVNQDRYDSVVNLADPSTAITNPDTWMPSPQGIWLGASTAESLFEFDHIMTADNVFQVHSQHRFNSTQIMNGASTTIIRSPIAADNVIEMKLRVFIVDDDWEIRFPFYPVPDITGDRIDVLSVDIDMGDTSVTEGGDQWTVDGRTYVKLYAPIYSGVNYVFSWWAKYAPDSRPAMYLSGQDICNDNVTKTQVSVYSKSSPDQSYTKVYSWDIDPGISFDCQQGLGNGVYAQSFYMNAGDTLSFQIVPLNNVGEYYDTVMIPFVTADGTINAKVRAERGGINAPFDDVWTPYWEAERTEWNGYILACSPNKLPSDVPDHIKITVEFLTPERVNWIFVDGASRDIGQNLYNRAVVTNDGIKHTVHSRVYASYQESIQPIYMPSLNPDDFPAMPEPQINDRVDWTGTIIGWAMILVGAALIPVGIGVPMLAGGILVGVGLGLVILDEIAHKKGYSGVGEYLGGIFSNALDNLWDKLQDVGNFIRAVGEAIYDGLVWFADAVTEYGSVLLGLLIIAVALALFFAPIYTQLKLWGIAWRMAEGDVQAAAAQAQDLASQASGIVSKFRRH